MLSQTDIDGTENVLNIIFTAVEDKTNLANLILRNPCIKNSCKVQWNGEPAHLDVLDARGVSVLSMNLEPCSLKLDLQPGLYLLNVISTANTTERKWLVVEAR